MKKLLHQNKGLIMAAEARLVFGYAEGMGEIVGQQTPKLDESAALPKYEEVEKNTGAALDKYIQEQLTALRNSQETEKAGEDQNPKNAGERKKADERREKAYKAVEADLAGLRTDSLNICKTLYDEMVAKREEMSKKYADSIMKKLNDAGMKERKESVKTDVNDVTNAMNTAGIDGSFVDYEASNIHVAPKASAGATEQYDRSQMFAATRAMLEAVYLEQGKKAAEDMAQKVHDATVPLNNGKDVNYEALRMAMGVNKDKDRTPAKLDSKEDRNGFGSLQYTVDENVCPATKGPEMTGRVWGFMYAANDTLKDEKDFKAYQAYLTAAVNKDGTKAADLQSPSEWAAEHAPLAITKNQEKVISDVLNQIKIPAGSETDKEVVAAKERRAAVENMLRAALNTDPNTENWDALIQNVLVSMVRNGAGKDDNYKDLKFEDLNLIDPAKLTAGREFYGNSRKYLGRAGEIYVSGLILGADWSSRDQLFRHTNDKGEIVTGHMASAYKEYIKKQLTAGEKTEGALLRGPNEWLRDKKDEVFLRDDLDGAGKKREFERIKREEYPAQVLLAINDKETGLQTFAQFYDAKKKEEEALTPPDTTAATPATAPTPAPAGKPAPGGAKAPAVGPVAGPSAAPKAAPATPGAGKQAPSAPKAAPGGSAPAKAPATAPVTPGRVTPNMPVATNTPSTNPGNKAPAKPGSAPTATTGAAPGTQPTTPSTPEQPPKQEQVAATTPAETNEPAEKVDPRLKEFLQDARRYARNATASNTTFDTIPSYRDALNTYLNRERGKEYRDMLGSETTFQDRDKNYQVKLTKSDDGSISVNVAIKPTTPLEAPAVTPPSRVASNTAPRVDHVDF
jgi:hypothetical protein